MSAQPTKPRLIKHHGYRSWTSTWRDARGHKRTVRFGREGDVSRREVDAVYDNWLQTRWLRFAHVRDPGVADAPITGTGLAAYYLRLASRTYVKRGRRTSSVDMVRYAMRALRDEHGDRPADELDNPGLAAIRDRMIRSRLPDGSVRVLAVNTVNARLEAIKAAYRKAREKGWVSGATLGDVLAVSRLRAGRSEAKPAGKVRPVDRGAVDRAVACMPSQLQAMVEAMWLSGMRPGEACLMRPADVDTTGVVWVYTPQEHKTEHHEDVEPRRVCLGPQAQAVLLPMLGRRLSAYVFSPREAHAERLEAKRAGRRTPPYPSHLRRHREDPTAGLGERYTSASLRRAVHHACDRAGVERWNPNQLRHAYATRVFKELGLDEVSKSMGHMDLDTTLIYAERDLQKAKDVARRLG